MVRSSGGPPLYRLLGLVVVCVLLKVNAQESATPSPCAVGPCQNGAQCVVENSNFMCLCPVGFYGKLCENRVSNSCQSNPCMNGGLCRDDSVNGFNCICQGGYTGFNCDQKPDRFENITRPMTTIPPTTTTPYAGCTCVNGYCSANGYCVCYAGYTGQDCRVATTTSPSRENTTSPDGILSCSDKVLGCYKPLRDFITNGDLTNIQKVCSLSLDSVQCLEKLQASCSQHLNLTDSIQQARQSYNTTCANDKCAILSMQCTNTRAAQFIADLEKKGQNISENLGQICSMMNGTLGCITKLMENVTDGCRSTLEQSYKQNKNSINMMCNHCYMNPCRNNGSCEDLMTDYKCTCPSPYYGKMCEFNKNYDAPCGSTYCQHGGTCIGDNYCQCAPDYSGYFCENRLTTVALPTTPPPPWTTILPNRCGNYTCLNGGSCDNNRCLCLFNYYGDQCQYSPYNSTTSMPVSMCNGGYCQNGAACWSSDYGDYCNCLPGFTGKYCESGLGNSISQCVDQVYKNINISQISNMTYYCSVQKHALSCYDGHLNNLTSSDKLGHLSLTNLTQVTCAKEPVSCVKTYVSCNRQTMEANVIKNNNPNSYDRMKVCSLYEESAKCMETKGYNSTGCPDMILQQIQSVMKGSETLGCTNSSTPTYITTTSSTVQLCNGDYCRNGGRCIQGSYCSCSAPYTGKYCEVYNLKCQPGVEKVECFINPCMGQTCSVNSSAKCVMNNCGKCDYMFVDDRGQHISCPAVEPVDICLSKVTKCANNAMINHTANDLVNPDMYCSINRQVLGCYQNLTDSCPSLAGSLNSTTQLMDTVCGRDGIPACFRTLLECTNSSMTMIGSILQHPSSVPRTDYCTIMSQTMTCVENYNRTECPSLLKQQINSMTVSYDSLCGASESCNGYKCYNGTCNSQGNGESYCSCDAGFYGLECNMNVCDYFNGNPCGQGTCIGQIETGDLCSCPSYREGILCEVNDYNEPLKECTKRKRLGKYILEILDGKQTAPPQLRVSVAYIFRELNSSWFQIPDCSSEGEYSGLMAEFNVYNTSQRNYYCVDKYGSQSIGSYLSSSPQNCLEFSSACDSSPCWNGGTCQDYYLGITNTFMCTCPPGYFGKQCQSRFCNSFQMDPCSLNSGKCLGDIDRGRLCSCPDGMMGPLCDQVGDDCNKTDCQRIYELTVEVEKFLNGSKTIPLLNARDMILSATNSINLTSMLLPICDRYGQPTNVECDVDVTDTTRKACYCLNQNGRRDSAPHYDGLPNCKRNHTGPCPPGVPVVMCAVDPCQVASCPGYPYTSCRANYCGGCNAEFFINGTKVDCSETKPDLSLDPPRIVSQSNGTVYFKSGEEVILYCMTTSHNFSHTWFKDGVKVDYGYPGHLNHNRVITRNGSLAIVNPNYTDEGKYQCQFGPVIGDFVTLREAKIGNAYNGHATHLVSLGESLKLDCKVGESSPPAQVLWMLERDFESPLEVNLTDRITMDYEGNLYFVNVRAEDSKLGVKYSCYGFNEPARMSQKANSYFIDIFDTTAPMKKFENRLMWNSRSMQPALLGEEYKLKCIFGGYPSPFVSIRRMNETKRTDTSAESKYYQNELVIKNVTMADAGEYECYANTEGSVIQSSRIMFIEVEAKPYFMEPPRNQAMKPGDMAVFKCKAGGIPTPTVHWYINGTSLQSINNTMYEYGYFVTTEERNTVLRLRHMKVYENNLVIQCNVSNSHGYLWTNMALTLQVRNQNNTMRPGRCPPVRNDTMGIGIQECSVDTDCIKDPALKCCFNGFGNQCMMPNRSPLRTSPVIIYQSPAMNYFISKTPSKLYCKAEGNDLSYTWYKDGVEFNFTDPRYLYRVIHNNGAIRNSETLRSLDDGVYQCKVSNENGTAIGRKIVLKEATFDNFIGVDKTQSVNIGTPLILYCNMPYSVPKAEITWILMNSSVSRNADQKNYSIVNLTNRINMDDQGNLLFVNVKASDAVDGKAYICMGVNPISKTERFTYYYTLNTSGDIAIRHAPDYQWASPRESTGMKGDEFSLKCIFSGYPTPEVEFERIDFKPMSDYVQKKSFGLELYFPSLNMEDAGGYRCFAKDGRNRRKRETDIRTFNVSVESKPYFNVEPNTDVQVIEGANTVFSCRAEGVPQPNITWYINGNKVLYASRFTVTGERNETLLIENVTLSDRFVVQCNASNTHGSLFMNMYLHVKPQMAMRPGRCPPVRNDTMGIGIQECSVDTDCIKDPALKCCSNGFGNQCMMPVNDTQVDCYSMTGQCLNGGNCMMRNSSTYCWCPRRYTGKRCQTWRSLPCDSYPCQNGASCQDVNENSYSCSCPSSWGKNCESPTHDNCTCNYNESCVLKESCDIENGRYFDCKKTQQCWSNSMYDPCVATLCPMNSECYIDVNSVGRCTCRKGFSGSDCSVNDKVCERFLNVSSCSMPGNGTCVGDLDNGIMCSCGAGKTGPFCDKASTGKVMSRCEKKKEFYDLLFSENSTRTHVIREMINSKWIPRVNCTPEGYFTPKQCYEQIHTKYPNSCKCVNYRGHVLSEMKTYPGHDTCTVPDSRVETARRICSTQMANDLCWNGGRCKGDILNGQICECRQGYSGLFCHKRGSEDVDDQSLCELNRQAFNLITQFTNSSGNFSDYMTRYHSVDETARRFLSILEVYLKDPMRAIFNDSFVPKANCTENGEFAPVQCVYNVTDMSLDACYCAYRNGTVIPGTRVNSPAMPMCDKRENETSCHPMEDCDISCGYGYQHDMSGCPICACKSPCAGKVCGQGHTCQLRQKQSCYNGFCDTPVCVPDNKDGKCPDDQYSNMTAVINKYLNNYDCTNECKDDSQCADDMVCCGQACGSKCIKPLGKRMCKNDMMKMKEKAELYEAVQMVLSNQSAAQAMDRQMVEYMKMFVSNGVIWKPSCVDDDTYQREQCYYNHTGVYRPAYCQCMTSDGVVISKTKHKVDNSTITQFKCQEKPGICPRVENGTVGMTVEMCSNDYDCNGLEKCCSNGGGHVCKHPVPKQQGHLAIPNICRYQTNVCTSVDRNAVCVGDWENGNMCHCKEKSGLLCKQPYSERKMTRCEQREKLYSILYNVTHRKPTEPGYNQIVTFVKGLQLPQIQNRTNMTFTLPKCHMMDGSFRNYQCDQYLFSNKTKECYCVNEMGHKYLGSEFKPDQEPKCTGYENPDTVCKLGQPLGNGKSYVQCNGTSPCAKGYECNLGRVQTSHGGYYSNGYCCLKQNALENRCNITVNKGVREEKCQKTQYYFNSGLQKCVKYNSSKCTKDVHQVNSFSTMQDCENYCLRNVNTGSCPRKPPRYNQTMNCKDECKDDKDCLSGKKCCGTSCAKRCIVSEDNMMKQSPCSPGVKPLQDRNCGRGGSKCPNGYYCDIAPNDMYAACCPDEPEDVCSLPKDSGPCYAAFNRWYFNSQTKQCEQFIYGGCSGNNNNFQTKEECCNLCGHEGCKEGQCPTIEKSIYASCDVKCKSDSDCAGGSMCCSNGCGMHCVAPTRNANSTCFRELEKANFKMSNKLVGQCTPVMIPRCNIDGSWNPEQCMDNYGLCWCVMKNGTKIPGTTVSGRAQCRFLPKKDSVTNHTQPWTNHTQPWTNHTRPGTNQTQPWTNQTQPRTNQTQPWTNHTRPETNQTQPWTNHTRPGTNQTQPWTNQTQPNNTSSPPETVNMCPPGESVHCCSADLCKMSVCPSHPSAVCRVNPCGKCSVVFYDYDNSVVNCTQGLSMCEKRRHAAVKARYQHAFNKMSNIHPMVVVRNDSIKTDMEVTPDKTVMEGNDSVCNLPPVTGTCRAYIPQWYYNPDTTLCQMFIYGGCGGNDNSFDRPEDCYARCSPQDSPCMNMPCADNEVCKIVFDPDCYRGICGQTPQCIKQHINPHITGVYVPECTDNDSYEYKQCHHGYCWCVTGDGEVFTRSLTRGPLTCSETGPVADAKFEPEVCTDGSSINMKCLDVCQDKLCPDHPEAMCSVDLCSTDCKVKFMNKTNQEVACGSNICKVVSDKPNKDCAAPVVCPGQMAPKLCPLDICDKASCYGNPCAICSVDPCTCKPVFVDIISNTTITDCSIITHTMCRMDYCNQMKDINRAKSMGQDSDMLLPGCDDTGRYNSTQCDSDTCWCVDGKGQWTKNLESAQDTCSRNETLEVTVQMKFAHDFSKVENNLGEFEQAVLELMKKWNIEEYVKSITIRAGSVIVETTFGSEDNEAPAPILSIIPDIIQNRVRQNDAAINWKGEEWKPESDYFVVASKYEKQDSDGGESTLAPVPGHKESGMDEKLIIVISVICGALGAAIIAIVVWACCCRKPVKKDTHFTDIDSDKRSPQLPFGVSNQTYLTNQMLTSNDQYIEGKPTLHTFGNHNKTVEVEDYENEEIKVKM